MEYRRFGDTEMMVHPITFGAWSIGGPANIGGIQVGWSGVDDHDSLEAVAAAVDRGINMFDTADSYAKGHSEELLGKALRGKRNKVYLSTKVGLVDAVDGAFKLDFSREHMIRSCEESLKRLSTDYIDVYLLHMVADGYPLTDEIKGTMEILQKQGKIRYYGVSVQAPRQGEEQLSKQFGKAMMLEYNPWTGSEAGDLICSAQDNRVGVITRGALAKGLLSGKYQPGYRFAKDDVRSRMSPAYMDEVLADVSQLKEYCGNIGGDLLSLALFYPLQNTGCSTVTVGMKTPGQVNEIVDAVERKVPYELKNITSIIRGVC